MPTVHPLRRAQTLGFVRAVTTNPAHIAKTGRPGLDVLRELLTVYNGPVFYQATAESVEARIAQIWEIYEIGADRVVIKVPATTENYTLVHNLAPSGITFCVTAACSAMQAYLAAEVGAAYVAPYVNRLMQQLGDGLAIVQQMASAVNSTQTRVLAASLKSVEQVGAALAAGAHDVTVPLELILVLGEHELTHQAMADFAAQMRASQV